MHQGTRTAGGLAGVVHAAAEVDNPVAAVNVKRSPFAVLRRARVGCIAGALHEDEYLAKLKAAGFETVELEPWRVYQLEDARTFFSDTGIDVDRIAPQVDSKIASAFIRAQRPEAQALLRTDVLLVTGHRESEETTDVSW